MTNKTCKIFCLILAGMGAIPANGAVRVNNSNRSYANAYQQVNAMRYQQEYLDATATNATTASATATLPVMVSDEKLANDILNNTSDVTVGQLEACSMIYPNGVFKWQIPESGIRQNQTNQCVAVVTLVDANTNAVLATTTLAAGDAMKCNIDSFPESGMNASVLSKTILPADNPPTMDDVESVMNQEQKQNAGIKIATGALISAVAGDALAKKNAGDTGILGTGKNQITGTAIGAVTGAGIMAAGAYTGKVAGDTINSAAVNAASGMIVGNMLAGANGGTEYLVVKKCKIEKATENVISAGEHDCIAGQIETFGNPIPSDNNKFYIIDKSQKVKECQKNNDTITCTSYKPLLNVQLQLKNGGGTISFDDITDGKNNSSIQDIERYISEEGSNIFTEIGDDYEKTNEYYKVASANLVGNTQPAYLVFNGDAGFNSYKKKKSELNSLIASKKFAYMRRNSDGSVGAAIKVEDSAQVHFEPITGDATDGGLIDVTNAARAKGTITGAATGGALGGFAGYQGAKSEIEDRWTAAIREYNDSLSNFVCMTGGRFLSQYNSYVEIPNMNKSE